MSNLFASLEKERQKQREMLAPPKRPLQNQPPTNQGNKETRKLPSKQTRKPGSQEVYLEPDAPNKPEFYRKQTFEFSESELDFLDEAKLKCKKRYGFRVTKAEIVRTALEFLGKDFQGNKETSFLARKFTGK